MSRVNICLKREKSLAYVTQKKKSQPHCPAEARHSGMQSMLSCLETWGTKIALVQGRSQTEWIKTPHLKSKKTKIYVKVTETHGKLIKTNLMLLRLADSLCFQSPSKEHCGHESLLIYNGTIGTWCCERACVGPHLSSQLWDLKIVFQISHISK